MTPILRVVLACSVLASACGGASPAAPSEPVRTANLVASDLQIGPCADRCAFTVTITNTGPDCAENVSASVTYLPDPSRAVALSTASGGSLRPGQRVTVAGTNLPPAAANVDVSAGGHAIACQ